MSTFPACLRASFLLPGFLALSLAGTTAQAQTPPANSAERDKISDAERAKRDAEKVFSFIKFHTVRPAAKEAAPVAPRTATRAGNAPSTSPATALVAALRSGAEPVAAPAPAPASGAANVPNPATAAPTAAAAPAPAASTAAVVPSAGQPAVATTLPEPAPTGVPTATQPVQEPAEEEEVPLKLVAYTPPLMSAQVLAAVPSAGVVVPVRFVVQPNGVVSQAEVRGVVPRPLARAATNAVQQWRFEPIPMRREVDVELSFKQE